MDGRYGDACYPPERGRHSPAARTEGSPSGARRRQPPPSGGGGAALLPLGTQRELCRLLDGQVAGLRLAPAQARGGSVGGGDGRCYRVTCTAHAGDAVRTAARQPGRRRYADTKEEEEDVWGELSLEFPPSFPRTPPLITCLTPIQHPSVAAGRRVRGTGVVIDVEALFEWRPEAISLVTLLSDVRQIVIEGSLGRPLDAATAARGSPSRGEIPSERASGEGNPISAATARRMSGVWVAVGTTVQSGRWYFMIRTEAVTEIPIHVCPFSIRF
jgi:hypothetical protein